jgi:hypothetical protein
MLPSLIKPFTMSASRSRDGFLSKGAVRQPVACARGSTALPSGKPGFCLRVRMSPTFVSAARCSYCIPFSSARGWVQRRFDEGLMESLADIALCLKMRRAGHLIVTLVLQNNTMIRSIRLARRLCGNGGLAFCSGTLIMIQVFLAKTPISR